MELKQFAEELKVRMTDEIDSISGAQPEALARTSQLITCAEKYLSGLKEFVVKYKFKSLMEEIEFFKTIKPQFASQLFYYKKLFKFKLFESYNSKVARLKYYNSQLKRLEDFMSKHSEFYHYIFSGSQGYDDRYFSRTKSGQSVILDERFSTSFDNKLSRILSNELVKDYLLKAIQEIEQPTAELEKSDLTWTGGKTDLIELIYALQASEVFNKGNAGLKQIASRFEIFFNISLGQYYRVFQEIRLRKKSQTAFLDLARERLIKRLNEMT
jgi:hypothetical protein